MSRNYQRGIVTAYDNSLSINQSGAGVMQKIRDAIKWAKNNKIVSKGKAIADTLGATGYLDAKTGGKFSQAADFGVQKGFGRRRIARPRQKALGRPRQKAGCRRR